MKSTNLITASVALTAGMLAACSSGGSSTSAAQAAASAAPVASRPMSVLLGPSIHHRRFFAPVVAAREKHQPWTIKREPDLFTVDTSLEVAVSVPN